MRRAERIGGIEMVLVFGIALEHHELLVIQHQVRTFVVGRKYPQGAIQLFSSAPSRCIAFRGGLAQFDQMQNLFGQSIADTGDRTHRAAAHKAVEDLRVDAHHQGQARIAASDVLGGIRQRLTATKLFEADQVGELFAQGKKQIGLRLKAIVWAVVNYGRQFASRCEDTRKVRELGGRRCAAGQHSGMTIKPAAPTSWAWAAWAAANFGF